jgi:SAM-dependent methyltransferase
MSAFTTVTRREKPNYALEAPRFQKVALYGGVACVVAGRILFEHGLMHQGGWPVKVGGAMIWAGFLFFVVGCLMFWASRAGKLHVRDAVLNSIEWRGDERVLDVGCGHGLMLVGAAKRLKTGRAVGLFWSQADHNNSLGKATAENARREGVAERIELKSALNGELPFADNSFDVIVSGFAIHNISEAAGREQAIREMARVLKPGGELAIADTRHTRKYEKVLHSLGWEKTRRSTPAFVMPGGVVRAIKP